MYHLLRSQAICPTIIVVVSLRTIPERQGVGMDSTCLCGTSLSLAAAISNETDPCITWTRMLPVDVNAFKATQPRWAYSNTRIDA